VSAAPLAQAFVYNRGKGLPRRIRLGARAGMLDEKQADPSPPWLDTPQLIIDGTSFLDANQAATVLMARHGLTLRFLRAEEAAIAGRVEMGWREQMTLPHRVQLANLVNEEISLLDEVSNTTA
jgi:hypothetical protein